MINHVKQPGRNSNRGTQAESQYHVSHLGDCMKTEQTLVVMLHQGHHHRGDDGDYSDGQQKEGEDRAFDINLKKELYNKRQDNPFKVPLYIAEASGEKIYIIPMLGAGLWGPIYGNIALKEDMNTVFGAEFGHDKETPGLGAEISMRDFAIQFVDKTIFTEDGKFFSLIVKKGGVETMPPADKVHGVDAVSGGTITSDAVTKMIRNCLENYVAYFKSQQ